MEEGTYYSEQDIMNLFENLTGERFVANTEEGN